MNRWSGFIKRALPLLMLPALLSGCSGTTVYSNYRDIAAIEIVRVMSADVSGGGMEVYAATGADDDGKPPKIYRWEGETFATAVNALRRLPVGKDSFFSHTEHIVIGEETARLGIAGIMDYIERAAEMRFDTNIFIVEGGKASELVLETTGEDTSAADMLYYLTQDASKTGTGFVPDCGDIAEALSGDGVALASAICLTESADAAEGSVESMIEMCGLAVIEDGSVTFFVPERETRGVTILMDKLEYATAAVPDGEGGSATLGITKAKPDVKAVYRDGALTEIDISVKIDANVLQLDNRIDIDSEDVRRALAVELAEAEREGIEGAIRLSQERGVDFLDLKGAAKRESPSKFKAVEGQWDVLFPRLPINVSIEASIKRTYDLEQAIPVTGEEGDR